MKTCILTIIKDEQEYLDEWIKYHLDLGIDHIFIFEDFDSGSHKNICDKYGDKVSLNSVSTLLDTERVKKRLFELRRTREDSPQHIYFQKGLMMLMNEYRNQYDWCFIIDNDEFITLENENDALEDVVSLYNEYDAFLMQWKCYGANGYVNKPNYNDKGVIETYTEEMKGFVPTNTFSYVKTCYNLNRYKTEYYLTTHQPSKLCNCCRTNFEKDRFKTHIYDKIYLRHYITKSWEEYIWKKRVRGYVFGMHRNFDFFFDVNPDMKDKKEELINSLEKETLVFLPYKQDEQQGNEIKLTLNGWRRFCKFKYHFIVIGEFDDSLREEFPWVEFICCPTIEKKEGQYRPHLDIQNKMRLIMEKYKNDYDGFIYINDDQYAVKPFDLEDITRIYYHERETMGIKSLPTYYWIHDKWKTRELLDRENLPHYNYTTHYPCYYEFSKLKEIWDKYNMLEESYAFDDIYFNYFKHEEPILDKEIRLGVWNKTIFERDFKNAIENKNIKFICNSVDGWSEELEKALSEVING